MRDTSRHFPIFSNRVTRHASRVTILFIAAVLAGCAIPAKRDIPAQQPADLHHWQASGRMAVSGAESGGSGSFTWRQAGGVSSVQLRGPVGIGSLRLSINGDHLRIETGDQVLESDAAQAELAARLGADVPVQSLRYWLIGTPAPGEHAWVQTGDTAALEQNNWRIDYQAFAVSDGWRLPAKLVATSGRAKVRIVLDRWKVESRAQ